MRFRPHAPRPRSPSARSPSADRHRPALGLLVGIALAVAATPAIAQAQTPDEDALSWRGAWARVGPGELVATAVLGLGALMISERLMPEGGRPLDVFALDEPAHQALHLGTPGARAAARLTSDLAVISSIAYPIVDALGVAWLGHGEGDVAFQLVAIDALSFAATGAIAALTKSRTQRSRPFVLHCADDADYDPDCDDADRFRSYFSGHTAFAVTAAALSCTHHARLALYGGGTADTMACVAAAAVATMTGLMRILADRHYLSDVLTGVVVGIASGWLMPTLLHYR